MEKQEQIPGINQETRKQGFLKGFEDNQIPPPPNYIQSMNPNVLNQMSGNACNRVSQLPMGIGQPNSIKIPLDPDYDSDYDSDDDESDEPYEPFVKTCLCCCNLGVGVILGSLFFLIFDAMLLIKKGTMMFEEDKNEISSLNFGMNTASIILNAFSCFSSFILMASACLCGTPERSTSMRFLVRYWMFTLGLNTAYQVIETLMNTLPDPNSIFVVSMPSLGFPEIMGPPAIIITWAFTSVYMFAYLYMCLVGISYTRELNVKIFKKEMKIESKINARIASQIPNFDDIQSNMTYTERLSDMSRESSEDVYQEVNGSDMTGLDDIYARKSGIKRSPSPRILQAQLAYLSPAQRIQFLTQLSQQGGLPVNGVGSSPSPSLPVGPNGLPVQVQSQGSVGPTGLPMLPGHIQQQKPQTDNSSDISNSSKPNSNGYNVRFGPDTKPADQSEIEKIKFQQQLMHQQMMTQQMMTQQAMTHPAHQAENRFSPNVTAPPYGPRPPCYEVAQGNAFPPTQFHQAMMQAQHPPHVINHAQAQHQPHMTQ